MIESLRADVERTRATIAAVNAALEWAHTARSIKDLYENATKARVNLTRTFTVADMEKIITAAQALGYQVNRAPA